MNNNDKNKNISNNYKDYKYVYTGYDEFIKSHHLDKQEIKKEKEKIIHDHRNVFDFNNPNQHTHDYSFDFNNPNEHQHDYSFDFSQKQQKTPYKDKYGNAYKEQSKITPSYNNQYNQKPAINTAKPTIAHNQNTAKAVKLIIFFFFLFPFIITILTPIIAFINEWDDHNNENKIEVVENSHNDPINAFCEGINNSSFSTISTYITDQELKYDNGYAWKYIISNNPENKNRTCSSNQSKTQLSEYQIRNLEDEFNYKYSTYETIQDAYKYTIHEYQDNYYEDTYYITIAKIDYQWYLLEIEYYN